MEKIRQCAVAADQLAAQQAEYKKRWDDYEFKIGHRLDAEMEECSLHWKDFVCLTRGGSDGTVSYTKEWNQAVEELDRKLSLEREELPKLEQQIATLSQSTCPSR
jgi:hypothetical protein